MEKPKILVVEDDAAIRQGLIDALEFSGYQVSEAPDGIEGLKKASSGIFDLILLDVLMPGLEGFEVLKQIRQTLPTQPVIMLTAKGTEEDKVKGLKGGADDYVVKPFGAKEVLARVEAVLRRSAERPHPISKVILGETEIDLTKQEAIRNGKTFELSQQENEFLLYLASNASRIIEREELLKNVWKLDPRGIHTRTIDMQVARLRDKIETDSSNPKIIITIRNKGYRLGSEAMVYES